MMKTTDKDVLYAQWLTYLFDRPDTKDPWYYSSETMYDDFIADTTDLVYLLGRTFAQCGTDLVNYSNTQLDNGFRYIFDNGASDTIFALLDETVDEKSRKAAIENMKFLYNDCFAKRCAPVLSNYNEPGNPLNSICYMLWDITPLSYWEAAERAGITQSLLNVMEFALYSGNDACIESGLHGLGHVGTDSDAVPGIIQKFVAQANSLRPELQHYAMHAATGMIL